MIPVIALVPPVQLEKVLPVTVLVALPEAVPSELLTPVMNVAPANVILEKLLLVKV